VPVEAALDRRTVDEQTMEDLHADAEYRRALVTTLVERALRAAAQRRSA
jgi:CO/xanthine dehydrogenase FAD-binding subunit